MKIIAAILLALAVSACAFNAKQANVCQVSAAAGCSNFDGVVQTELPSGP